MRCLNFIVDDLGDFDELETSEVGGNIGMGSEMARKSNSRKIGILIPQSKSFSLDVQKIAQGD